MVSIYDLKPKFQHWLRPMVVWCAQKNITANHVTVAALVMSVLFGVCVYLSRSEALMTLLPLVLFIRMALNAIDGMLAREHHMQSALGAILNELSDVISDMALYFPFMVLSGVAPLAVVLLVCLAIVSEMTGVVAIQVGADRRYDGPMGKSDRAFVLGAVALFYGLGWMSAVIVNTIFNLVIVLLLWTIYNRAKKALNGRN